MKTDLKQGEKKKINVKTLAGIVFGIAVMALVQHFFFKPPSFDKQLMQVASELNKTCPVMVDSETQLDNTIALPGKTFQYNYTLINTVKDSVDIANLEAYMKTSILNTIKTSPDLKTFRDNDVIMTYSYKDKNSVHLLKMTFTPDQYK